jgi:xanthine dehydrogenase YagR molybdenum-binding subunit
MADPAWPPAEARRLIGRRTSRLDGPAKVTGSAKYTADVNRPGLLHARVLRCPHAHAKVVKLDVAAAAALPGVKAVRVIQGPGSEVQWALDEVAVVAATSGAIAEDALRLIAVEYEVLPHQVRDDTLEGAAGAKPGAEEVEGDPETALAAAAVRLKGLYGMPVIAHNCLEPHGQVCEWTGKGEAAELTAWCSTQAVSALAPQFAEGLGIPAADVRVITQYMGGGFGSKFSPDRWGIECAELARQAGAPVKLMLDRAAELTVAGDRPSAWAEIEVGAAEDGTLTAWRSSSWGSGGLGSAGDPPLPYVFQVPARRQRHTAVPTHTASSRAWRAPNHPQGCFLTMSALEDLAARLGMDPYDLFLKNLPLTGRLADVYQQELEIAESLMGWKARWHPRGAGGPGPVQHGLGLSLHTWGGGGHRSSCEVILQPDGQVEAKISSQDIGTGTRTVIAVVLADTLGLPLEAIKVSLGDSRYPASGGSGGSSTVGGVSAAVRRAGLNALALVFGKVAPELGAAPDQLEAVDGVIRLQGTPSRQLTWKQAVAHFGRTPVSVTGAHPGPGELTGAGVGGVQMAAVAVDVETGVVKVEKMVAVQDCGLIIDLKTAESQVYGGLIMGISGALCEEKVVDPLTGRTLNVDFESYRMAGIGDVGELVVHLMSGPGFDERGVIGLGEPPVISPAAAIANAVANATGVRVPFLPLTPERVLDALTAAGKELA